MPFWGYITSVGHEVPVGHMVGIERLLDRGWRPTGPTLVPVTSEDSVTEPCADDFLIRRHLSYSAQRRLASRQHRTMTCWSCTSRASYRDRTGVSWLEARGTAHYTKLAYDFTCTLLLIAYTTASRRLASMVTLRSNLRALLPAPSRWQRDVLLTELRLRKLLYLLKRS